MIYTTIYKYSELLDLEKKYKFIILRYSTEWCSSCLEIKDQINKFVAELDIPNTIFVDVDFESYQEDIDFQDYIFIDKLPTFYCIDKFKYSGKDLDKIKSLIISLKDISEDF